MNDIHSADILIREHDVTQQGIHERRKGGILLARTGETLAVKWPKSSLYHSNGGQTTSHPPVIGVYRINSEREYRRGTMLEVTMLLEWDAGRKRPEGSVSL